MFTQMPDTEACAGCHQVPRCSHRAWLSLCAPNGAAQIFKSLQLHVFVQYCPLLVFVQYWPLFVDKNSKHMMMNPFMSSATLVAVFAALSPTALVAGQSIFTCGGLVGAGDAACGSGYVLSRRDGEPCIDSGNPCDVDTVGADDHPTCCMVR